MKPLQNSNKVLLQVKTLISWCYVVSIRIMKKLTVSFCFLLLDHSLRLSVLTQSVEKSALHEDEKIVGGERIPLSDAPYQVSLQYRGTHDCGGAILSPNYILTAAHCTHKIKIKHLTVRIGTEHAGVRGEVIAIKAIAIHPNYNEFTANNDFSLMQVAKKITLIPGVKEIISLPPLNDPIAVGSLSYVSGWGDTNNSQESTLFLRAATVPIVSQADCKAVYPRLTKNMICAGDLSQGGKDACQVKLIEEVFKYPKCFFVQGDSGGPLKRISDGVLIGVVSFGNGCGAPGYPGVYSRVSAARNWIKKVAKI